MIHVGLLSQLANLKTNIYKDEHKQDAQVLVNDDSFVTLEDHCCAFERHQQRQEAAAVIAVAPNAALVGARHAGLRPPVPGLMQAGEEET